MTSGGWGYRLESVFRRKALYRASSDARIAEAERLAGIPKVVITGKQRFKRDMDTAWDGGMKHSDDTPIMDIAGWGDPD